jgi:hypothetical protein
VQFYSARVSWHTAVAVEDPVGNGDDGSRFVSRHCAKLTVLPLGPWRVDASTSGFSVKILRPDRDGLFYTVSPLPSRLLFLEDITKRGHLRTMAKGGFCPLQSKLYPRRTSKEHVRFT